MGASNGWSQRLTGKRQTMKTVLIIIALALCAGFCVAKPRKKAQLLDASPPMQCGKETIG
jgi:hypothetical protein